MSVYSEFFPLGLGTSRFPVAGPDDAAGLERSIQIVLRALDAGINYVDVGYNYSAGMATQILREAFRQTTRPFSVSAKVMYGQDHTADDARKRLELYLKAMGLEKVQLFTCWTIWNYKTFEQIMAKGGIYEGALRLKEEGLADHICCSLHAPPEDILKILESGAFEGITISYSLLNAPQMQPVLDLAQEKDIGVMVMNPLGGGVIPQNRDFFSFACGDKDCGGAVHAALRFVKAHPAVDVVLGGVSSVEELEDSLSVLSTPDPETPSERLERVLKKASELKGFCTGCKYCEGCPEGIPTAQIMNARNTLLFEPVKSYNREGPEPLLRNLQLFRPLLHDHGWLPETSENPCVKCGRCEGKCTQKLSIIDAVEDTYRRASEAYFTKADRRKRLEELVYQKGYRSVGLYPNGGFADLIVKLYREFFGEPDFEWLAFNSDPKMWGQMADGMVIHAPSEIPELRPDLMIIDTFKFDCEIECALSSYRDMGIRIEKLHREGEVPWVF